MSVWRAIAFAGLGAAGMGGCGRIGYAGRIEAATDAVTDRMEDETPEAASEIGVDTADDRQDAVDDAIVDALDGGDASGDGGSRRPSVVVTYPAGSSAEWGSLHYAALDSAGNVYTTAYFNGTRDFGTGPLASPSAFSSALLSVSPAGAARWARHLVSAGSEHVGAGRISVGASGLVAMQSRSEAPL